MKSNSSNADGFSRDVGIADSNLLEILPHDAMRMCNLCCHPVSVSLSACLSRIVPRLLKISSNFFFSPIAHHSNFLTPCTDTQFQGEHHQRRRKIHGVENSVCLNFD